MQKKEENRWQPVECASRSLTETEKRYSQLEKETLAVRWECERCYMYLIGSTFVVETDHKPLLPLFNNPNSFPPLRIERWLLYLQQFDFKLVYCPGKDNAADYLSRHAIPATSTERKESESRRRTVHAIIQDSLPKSISLTEIREATKVDAVGTLHPARKDPEVSERFFDQTFCKRILRTELHRWNSHAR